MQLYGAPSPSGESLGEHHQGPTSHLEKQVQGLDLLMEYKVSSNTRQLPVCAVQEEAVVVQVCDVSASVCNAFLKNEKFMFAVKIS